MRFCKSFTQWPAIQIPQTFSVNHETMWIIVDPCRSIQNLQNSLVAFLRHCQKKQKSNSLRSGLEIIHFSSVNFNHLLPSPRATSLTVAAVGRLAQAAQASGAFSAEENHLTCHPRHRLHSQPQKPCTSLFVVQFAVQRF